MDICTVLYAYLYETTLDEWNKRVLGYCQRMDAEKITCTDLMGTRKAVNFIEKYDRVSESRKGLRHFDLGPSSLRTSPWTATGLSPLRK
jgi:hypothetical protein